MRYLGHCYRFHFYHNAKDSEPFVVVLAPSRREALAVLGLTLADWKARKVDVWNVGRHYQPPTEPTTPAYDPRHFWN